MFPDRTHPWICQYKGVLTKWTAVNVPSGISRALFLFSVKCVRTGSSSDLRICTYERNMPPQSPRCCQSLSLVRWERKDNWVPSGPERQGRGALTHKSSMALSDNSLAVEDGLGGEPMVAEGGLEVPMAPVAVTWAWAYSKSSMIFIAI